VSIESAAGERPDFFPRHFGRDSLAACRGVDAGRLVWRHLG
jgi:hypothetical protein